MESKHVRRTINLKTSELLTYRPNVGQHVAHSCTMIIQFDVCIMSHNCYSVFGKFGVVNDIVNSLLVLSKISDCGF